MKNIYKVIILLVICFLPVMVDAKATFEYKNQFINKKFFFKENKEYYFLDNNYDFDEVGFIKIYDRNNNIIREDKFIDEVDGSLNSFIESKYFDYYYKFFQRFSNVAYDSLNKMVYNVNYNSRYFYYYDDDSNYIEISFNDDIEFTKRLLGKKYDIALSAFNDDLYIYNIVEDNGYYILYYEDRDYGIVILDDELEIVKTYTTTNNNVIVHVYNDLIFLMKDNTNLEVYNLNGEEVGNLKIDNEYISYDEYNGYCGQFYPYKIDVIDDELFIYYDVYSCAERVNYYDQSDFDSSRISFYIENFTLKYQINFDVEKVESSNGDFTYEEKIDENGKSYVELKISPKDGYVVDKIIVTDTNGNKIEVVDNKFYKPTNNVKIDVQYKIAGEYVPIPDTFLGKSLTLIIIGLILIGLGVYTVNYVKN